MRREMVGSMKIGVIGHFGLGLDLANGQTIKTKVITERLEEKCNQKAYIVDTHGGIKVIFSIVYKTIIALFKCENIIIMLAENGLKICVPILYFFNHFFNRKLHYIVIGGWLPVFLSSHPYLAKELRKFEYIYVETNNMKENLCEKGFNNVLIMPNCKPLKPMRIENLQQNFIKPFKLCTFSRVMKEKGIEDAIDAVINANDILGNVYLLDIYGQIDSNQIEWFSRLEESFPENIKYCGVVDFDKSTDVLKDYFALLFPTYYEGEGLAGTAIDAFFAGVPVVASDWKYNNEVIKNDVTGKLFQTSNVTEFTKVLVDIAQNPTNWISLKKNCIYEARKYELDKVMSVILNNI